MAVHVAFLRGINVGGHNMIRMDELKHALEATGLRQVQTYIQSGNVLFESGEDEETLRARIERAIKERSGILTTVVLRTAAELEQIIAGCPFSQEAISEAQASSRGECLHVAMLLESPSSEAIGRLNASTDGGDEFRAVGRDIYLLFRHGVYGSKLAGALKKLDAPPTARNWKTISKLVTLAKAIDARQ